MQDYSPRKLHQINLRWHPKGEEVLWRQTFQEQGFQGERGLRYERNLKHTFVCEFREQLAEKVSYCEVRYAF